MCQALYGVPGRGLEMHHGTFRCQEHVGQCGRQDGYLDIDLYLKMAVAMEGIKELRGSGRESCFCLGGWHHGKVNTELSLGAWVRFKGTQTW